MDPKKLYVLEFSVYWFVKIWKIDPCFQNILVDILKAPPRLRDNHYTICSSNQYPVKFSFH